MAREIRRPGEKSSSNGLTIFIILILVILGALYLLAPNEMFIDLFEDSSSKESSKILKSENKALRVEIDSLKTRIRKFESTVDDSKNKIEDAKLDIRLLKRDISSLEIELQEKGQEIEGLKGKSIGTSTQSISRNSVNRKTTVEDRQTDLSSKQKLVVGPKLFYPRRALQRELEGKVSIVFDISLEGKPFNIRVLSSAYDIFKKPAQDAVKKMRYTPARDIKGTPVIVKNVEFSLSFKLD
jgi:TonB family protein|tara:strand:+ start:1631 stop:2350 length:720 start_codon:yes stop_codon:yes gene_type:complete